MLYTPVPRVVEIDKEEIVSLTAVEGDIKTRIYYLRLSYQGAILDLTDCKVTIYAVNSLVNTIWNTLEVINAQQGLVKWELTDKFMVQGTTKYQYIINTADGGTLTSKKYSLFVSKSLFNSKAIESTNEFTVLKEMLKDVTNIQVNINKANANAENALDTANSNKEELKSTEENLNNTKNNLEEFKNKFKFDISKLKPCFLTTLELKEGSCLQCLVVKEDFMYATQVQDKPGNGKSESFTINRLDKHGNLLDYMVVKYGGHGSSIAVEKENGKTYIWSNYDIVQADGTKLGTTVVRFPYVPNKTIVWGDSSIERYKDFLDYAVPYIDDINNKIAFRIKYTDIKQIVELYDFSEFKAKRFNLLYTWTITPDLQFLQGFAIDNYYIYWRTGDGNSLTFKEKITIIDIKTGKVKQEIAPNFCNIGNEGNYREPEGLFLYTNPKNDKKTLFVPVCTGAPGQRVTKLYMYNEYGEYNEFAGDIEEVTQQHKLVEKGGYCKYLPNVTKIVYIDVPGIYYMSNNESKKFEDHPDKSTSSGWWLEVKAKNPNGEFIQILRRNNLNSFDTYQNIVRSKTELSGFKKIF